MAHAKYARLRWAGRRCQVLASVFALTVTMGVEQTIVARAQTQPPQVRTLDDLFNDVAKRVPDFGGLFLTDDETALEVYLLDPSPGKAKAVETAIAQVFGRQAIPAKGIKARKGQYGFQQLKQWYERLAGPVLSIKGVHLTDIDEAKNRLRVGIAGTEIEAAVVEQLTRLGIPRTVVVIDVISLPVMGAQSKSEEDTVQAASTTLHDSLRPTQGGYQLVRAATGGGGCSLGFNAQRAGVPGFVTSSPGCTDITWQVDGMGFYQGFPIASNFVGTETVDPPGFLSPSFPCQKYMRCRYSYGAFAAYEAGITSAQGVVGRTTGLTTTSTYNVTIDAVKKLGIAGPPTQPYFIGLTLNKVGRRTGWTNGRITGTCQTWSFPPNNLLICQYALGNTVTAAIGDVTDYGAPVFRFRNVSAQNWEHVELYGMLWGLTYPSPYHAFTFSPIGGVPFQQSGIQSPTDLGPLDYINCNLPPGPATC